MVLNIHWKPYKNKTKKETKTHSSLVSQAVIQSVSKSLNVFFVCCLSVTLSFRQSVNQLASPSISKSLILGRSVQNNNNNNNNKKPK